MICHDFASFGIRGKEMHRITRRKRERENRQNVRDRQARENQKHTQDKRQKAKRQDMLCPQLLVYPSRKYTILRDVCRVTVECVGFDFSYSVHASGTFLTYEVTYTIAMTWTSYCGGSVSVPLLATFFIQPFWWICFRASRHFTSHSVVEPSKNNRIGTNTFQILKADHVLFCLYVHSKEKHWKLLQASLLMYI